MRGLQEIIKDNENAHKIATAPRTLANATVAEQVAGGVGGIVAQRAKAKSTASTSEWSKQSNGKWEKSVETV